MQSVLSRIWTRVAVSISYDDNHYTTSTFNAYANYTKEIIICLSTVSSRIWATESISKDDNRYAMFRDHF